MSDEYGRQFLEIWPTISTITDVATITTFVAAARHSVAKVGQNLTPVERLAIETEIIKAEAKAATNPYWLPSARQRAITRFGKEAEDLIYLKFTNDGGAAAEIIDYFGREGLEVLKRVDNLDDAAGELIKTKVGYRYISNDASYLLQQLKETGVITKTPDKTYFTLDKFDTPTEAIIKCQLPGDATWRAEFDTGQFINNVNFPNAKWNDADYIEVLTRSYPNFGEGEHLNSSHSLK